MPEELNGFVWDLKQDASRPADPAINRVVLFAAMCTSYHLSTTALDWMTKRKFRTVDAIFAAVMYPIARYRTSDHEKKVLIQ